MHAPIPWMRPWLLEIYTITCINTRKYTYDNGSLASDRFDFDQLKTTTKKTAKLEPSKTIYSLKSNSVTNTPAIKTSHEQSHFVFFSSFCEFHSICRFTIFWLKTIESFRIARGHHDWKYVENVVSLLLATNTIQWQTQQQQQLHIFHLFIHVRPFILFSVLMYGLRKANITHSSPILHKYKYTNQYLVECRRSERTAICKCFVWQYAWAMRRVNQSLSAQFLCNGK